MTRKEILAAAESCVCGDRDKQYGAPEDSFAAIADLWNAYILRKTKLNPKDVANMLILMKVARNLCGREKDDNWIDIAGYAACGAEVPNAPIC